MAGKRAAEGGRKERPGGGGEGTNERDGKTVLPWTSDVVRPLGNARVRPLYFYYDAGNVRTGLFSGLLRANAFAAFKVVRVNTFRILTPSRPFFSPIGRRWFLLAARASSRTDFFSCLALGGEHVTHYRLDGSLRARDLYNL